MELFAVEVTRRLDTLRASQNFLADYVGISSGRLSMCLRGHRPLDSELTRKIRTALAELEELVQLFRPLSLNFHDAAAVKSVIHGAMSLPRLFAVIGNAEILQNATAQEFAIAGELIRAGNEVSERIQAEIAITQEQTRKLFEAWMENPSGR
jgi:hypothetical protein